jgi:hypothetical protein
MANAKTKTSRKPTKAAKPKGGAKPSKPEKKVPWSQLLRWDPNLERVLHETGSGKLHPALEVLANIAAKCAGKYHREYHQMIAVRMIRDAFIRAGQNDPDWQIYFNPQYSWALRDIGMDVRGLRKEIASGNRKGVERIIWQTLNNYGKRRATA